MRQSSDRRGCPKFREQALKKIETVRIVGQSRRTGGCHRRFERCIPCSEQRADQRVKSLELVGQSKLAGNPASFISQTLDGGLARVTQYLVQAFFDLAPRQRPSHAVPCARWPHVFQEGSSP